MNWTPPDHWRKITAIDAHTAGEPLRMITSGFPDLPGATMLAKRKYAQDQFDDLRRALMWEPRGHADMYGCLLTEPVTDDGDAGVLFLHNEGFSTMCGHGIIGLVKIGIEAGLLPSYEPHSEIKIDTPAGRVTAKAHMRGKQVERVSFLNVPSFVLAEDLEVKVEGLGVVPYTIAFGGAFYAFVDAEVVDVDLYSQKQAPLAEVGMRIKRAVMDAYAIEHPDGEADLNFLYGTIFVKMLPDEVHSRNVCVFAEGEVDRCPTGTGVSARAAIHYGRGQIGMHERITIESLISSRFDVQVVGETRVGHLPAIIPEVTGTAYITGINTLLIDPEDPLRDGFLLR